jgi:hypothetical protein
VPAQTPMTTVAAAPTHKVSATASGTDSDSQWEQS